MRIFILTLGTRGDVDLFLVLGRELSRRGHFVVVGTSRFYRPEVQDAGLEWTPVGRGSWEQMLAVLRSLGGLEDKTTRALAYYRGWLLPELAAAQGQISAQAGRADYFISNLKMILRREGRILPGAAVTYDPPAALDELSRYGTQQHLGAILDLVAMSKGLIDPAGAWGSTYHFTGFWGDTGRMAPVWQPSAELQSYLHQDPPPVVVSLGSMVGLDMGRFVSRLGEALRLCGRRAVLILGWSAPPAVEGSPGICLVQEAPYERIFPRSCCVIHHGSYGATAAALRAGRPAIVLPQLGCQELMGRVLTGAGLATGVFELHSLTPGDLAGAIDRAATDEKVNERARAWQRVVSEESGVRAAADLIEAHYQGLVGGTCSEARQEGAPHCD